MSVILGSARIDEHNSAHGGSAGDQKQKSTPDFSGEVSMQSFYVHSKGWIVARLKDAKQAKKCAKAMKTACNNPNIGYDQWQRYGLVKEDVDTKNKVETDCSALVRRCILDATGVDVGDIRTITMESVLSKSGLFQPLKQYTSGMTLCTGDVLFTGHLGHPVSGHTVVVVQGADRDDDSDDTSDGIKVAKPTLRKGDKSIEVKCLQKDLNKLGIKDDRQVKLVIDGDFGIHTESSLKRFQKIYKIEIDGIYGLESYETMKKAIKENV